VFRAFNSWYDGGKALRHVRRDREADGLSNNVAPGAIICVASFGDRMTPLSENTILVPKPVGRGLTVGRHVQNMVWTARPALGVSLLIFHVLRLNRAARGAISLGGARRVLDREFNITSRNLLPRVLLVALTLKAPQSRDRRICPSPPVPTGGGTPKHSSTSRIPSPRRRSHERR
jgi:hypothetical protein